MKVLVINGCPKGNNSVTLHTSLFIEKKYPEHEFTFYNAGFLVKKAEKDFSEPLALIKEADLLLFSYPVYTYLVPSQLHRFIELMKQNVPAEDLKGKFSTQITTSMHFYDDTAHAFIIENCQDMGLKVIKGFSAYMDDLTTEKGQKEAYDFFGYVSWCVENDIFEFSTRKQSEPKHKEITTYIYDESEFEVKYTVALVVDLAPEDRQLRDMINHFSYMARDEKIAIRLVNIHDFPFKGGCINCFSCSADGTCIYNDGFSDLLRNKIQTCDGIVLAFSISNHSMGSKFKTFDDRQFCNGHRTVTAGMPFGYLVSGNYSEEINLQRIIESRAEVGGNFLAGVATDEFDPNGEIGILIKRLAYALEHKYVQPQNFLGVGGMRIFRDLIWQNRGMMRADHKFYKEHGLYDFPQKNKGRTILMYAVGEMINNPKLKKKVGNKIIDGMVAPYKKVVDSLQ